MSGAWPASAAAAGGQPGRLADAPRNTAAAVHRRDTAARLCPATVGLDATERERWAALAPVREAMLRRARDEAGRIIAEARRQAAGTRDQAWREAAERLARAGAEGRAQAAGLADAQLRRARREARSQVLSARREAYERLAAEVRDAVCALRDGPGYGQLRQRLAAAAERLSGPGATLSEGPAGGVIARAPGIIVDCSLPRLADTVLETLGPELDRLWAEPGEGAR